MQYMIETKNLTKQYGRKKAVDDVSIHIKQGEIYGLIGKNGAGKTTLMKLLLNLAAPNAGEISLFDGESRARLKTSSASASLSAPTTASCTACLRWSDSPTPAAKRQDSSPLACASGWGLRLRCSASRSC